MIYKNIAVCIFLALICAGCVDEPEGSLLAVGDDLPHFSVTLSGGTEVTSEQLAAQGGIILFFNTGCEDCRRELPLWQKYYEATHCNIVCISREEDAASVSDYWRLHHLTMPRSAQSDRRIYSLFAITGIPRAYAIAPPGRISALYTTPPPVTDSK